MEKQIRGKCRVVGTVTVIGNFSFFCAVIKFLALMVPSLNDIQIHGCLVFHVVPELPNRSALLSSRLLEKIKCYKRHEQRKAIS
jgi:hypothetical protein